MIEFPEMVAGEYLTISATAYGHYRQCPDRALAHLEGRYGPASVASFRGGLAHQVFARHLTEGPIERQDMSQILREAIGSNKGLNNSMAELTREGELRFSDLEVVFQEVGDLYEQFCQYPADGFREAELFLEYELPQGSVLLGRVDAYFEDGGRVRLVDWKTGQLGEAYNQLLFYALVWALTRGKKPDMVEAVSLSTGERELQEVGQEDLQKTATEIAQMINDARIALATNHRLMREPGPHCRYCPIKHFCPEGLVAIEILSDRRD